MGSILDISFCNTAHCAIQLCRAEPECFCALLSGAGFLMASLWPDTEHWGRKIDDEAVTLAVTQQGKRKDTALGTCLPFLTASSVVCCLTECLALTSGTLRLCCHEKQIAKLVFYNKLLLWGLSKDKLRLWQREAAGGPTELGLFFLRKKPLLPFPLCRTSSPDPRTFWREAAIAL